MLGFVKTQTTYGPADGAPDGYLLGRRAAGLGNSVTSPPRVLRVTAQHVTIHIS